jgi:ketosteroid isomerase-like protein
MAATGTTEHTDALATIKTFWQIQDGHDYTRLVQLFADDAILDDPFYGRFEGRAAIAGFMAKMNEEMTQQRIRFTLVECAGGGDTGWAQWIAHTPDGERQGCGLYRVAHGKLTYYRDYMM